MDAEKLKALCEKRGLSIAALERKSDLANGTIRAWLSGSEPTLENVLKVARALQVPLEMLLKDGENYGKRK